MSTDDKQGEIERFQQLMTAAIDGELTPEEEREFKQLLRTSPQHHQQWIEHQKLKGLTMKLRLTEPPPEVWDHYWTSVYRRLERGVAWVFVSIGAIIVMGFVARHVIEAMLADSDVHWLFKAGLLLLAGGGIILFVSVVRERWFASKTDQYKEIQR